MNYHPEISIISFLSFFHLFHLGGSFFNWIQWPNRGKPFHCRVEHKCCNLYNPREPKIVPTHVDNDCFIYELVSPSTGERKGRGGEGATSSKYALIIDLLQGKDENSSDHGTLWYPLEWGISNRLLFHMEDGLKWVWSLTQSNRK